MNRDHAHCGESWQYRDKIATYTASAAPAPAPDTGSATPALSPDTGSATPSPAPDAGTATLAPSPTASDKSQSESASHLSRGSLGVFWSQTLRIKEPAKTIPS